MIICFNWTALRQKPKKTFANEAQSNVNEMPANSKSELKNIADEAMKERTENWRYAICFSGKILQNQINK